MSIDFSTKTVYTTYFKKVNQNIEAGSFDNFKSFSISTDMQNIHALEISKQGSYLIAGGFNPGKIIIFEILKNGKNKLIF